MGYGSSLDRSWGLCNFLLGVRFGIMYCIVNGVGFVGHFDSISIPKSSAV